MRRRGGLSILVLIAATAATAAIAASCSPAAPSRAALPAAPTSSTAAPVASGTATAVATAEATANATAPASPSPAPTLSTAALQGVLDEMRRSYGSIGAMAVVADGAERRFLTSGTADRSGRAISATTRFRVASITKPIVATLVLRAVAEGKLGLDDRVGDVLPGVLRPAPPVTVRQLLNHTSGLFDEQFGGNPSTDAAKLTDPALRSEAEKALAQYQAGQRVILSDRVIVAMAETHPRYFAPGEGYRYSNTNYQVAAMILRTVTGKSLADLLATEITGPLGLSHTSIAPPDLAAPEFHGYMPGRTGQTDVTNRLFLYGNGGNGGVITTPDELLTIMQAIVGGRLLPPDLAAEMQTVYEENYGLGLETYPSAFSCGTFWGHTGGINGTTSIAVVSADGAHGVVFSMNIWSASIDRHLEKWAARFVCPG